MEATARTIYTNKEWEKDVCFNAQKGQEIEESIYWEMFDSLTPKINTNHYFTITKSDHLEEIEVSYFLDGGTYDHKGENGRARYSLFINYNNKYYYGGLIEFDPVKVARRVENIIESL